MSSRATALSCLSLALFALAGSGCGDLTKTGPKSPAVARRLAELNARLASAPEDAKLHAELGDAYSEAEDPLQAADHYLRALDLGAKDGHIFGALADIYIRIGYGPSAVAQLKKCMEISRGEPECLLALGLLFESDPSRAMQSEARKFYRQMLSVAPNHPRAAYVRSRIDQLNAKLGPETAAEASPHGAMAGGDDGDSEGGGDGDEASDPQTGGADPHQAITGGADPHAGDVGGEIPGHSGDPTDAEVGELNEFGVLLQRAYKAVKSDDAKAAEAAFREALKLRPTDATALAGLAQTLLVQNRGPDALASAEAAVKSDPGDSQAQYTLGLVLLRARRSIEDIKRGIVTWEGLVKSDPEYAKRLGVQDELDQLKRAVKQAAVHPSAK